MNKLSILTILLIILMSGSVLASSTILSISPNVQFVSNDPSVSGSAFLVTGTGNSGGDNLLFSDKLSTTSAISKDVVKITSKLSNYRIEYPIIKSDYVKSIEHFKDSNGNNLYYYIIPGINGGQKCLNAGADFGVSNAFYGIGTIDCYKWQIVGVSGDISTIGNIKYNLDFTITGNSGTDTISLSSNNKNGVSRNGKVSVTLGDSKLSDMTTPVPSAEYDVFFKEGNQYLVRSYLIGAYLDQYNLINRAISDGMFPGDANTEIYRLNTKVQNFQPVALREYNPEITADVNSGMVVLTPPMGQEWTYPEFTMKINAAWVGIEQNVGDPTIVSATSECTSEGNQGKISLQVRNDGKVSSSFSVSLTCDKNFNYGNTNPFDVMPGQTYSLSIPLTGSTSSKLEGNCVVKVYTTKNGAISDQRNVNVCVTNAVTCSKVGELSCDSSGQNINICKTINGVNVPTFQTACANGCDSGKCIIKDDGDDGTKTPNFAAFFWTFILSLILSILITMYIVTKMPDYKMKWLVGILIGLAIFVALFFVFAWVVKIVISIAKFMSL